MPVPVIQQRQWRSDSHDQRAQTKQRPFRQGEQKCPLRIKHHSKFFKQRTAISHFKERTHRSQSHAKFLRGARHIKILFTLGIHKNNQLRMNFLFLKENP